ncbi:MAG: type II toxin-antitoxin system VapB family antitoxin [Acidimicrobiales bacterium]
MLRRTTIELDEELVADAKRALGTRTTRATVEMALRMAADASGAERERRAAGQRRYLDGLASRTDIELLGSDDMWR